VIRPGAWQNGTIGRTSIHAVFPWWKKVSAFFFGGVEMQIEIDKLNTSTVSDSLK
jgi:hypothetical protein